MRVSSEFSVLPPAGTLVPSRKSSLRKPAMGCSPALYTMTLVSWVELRPVLVRVMEPAAKAPRLTGVTCVGEKVTV